MKTTLKTTLKKILKKILNAIGGLFFAAVTVIGMIYLFSLAVEDIIILRKPTPLEIKYQKCLDNNLSDSSIRVIHSLSYDLMYLEKRSDEYLLTKTKIEMMEENCIPCKGIKDSLEKVQKGE